MGMYQHMRELWKQPSDELLKPRMIQWRKEPVTLRIERPTRLDRARSLGYRAKPGFIIVRQRVDRGGRLREKIRKGRRTKHRSRRKNLRMNYQWVAEQRAESKYVNCAVLNSYPLAKDKDHYWYEVILVDRANPHILADPKINWICDKKGRAKRGLTSAARRSRGLQHKGKGYEKMRPSLRSNLWSTNK